MSVFLFIPLFDRLFTVLAMLLVFDLRFLLVKPNSGVWIGARGTGPASPLTASINVNNTLHKIIRKSRDMESSVEEVAIGGALENWG